MFEKPTFQDQRARSAHRRSGGIRRVSCVSNSVLGNLFGGGRAGVVQHSCASAPLDCAALCKAFRDCTTLSTKRDAAFQSGWTSACRSTASGALQAEHARREHPPSHRGRVPCMCAEARPHLELGIAVCTQPPRERQKATGRLPEGNRPAPNSQPELTHVPTSCRGRSWD